MIRQRIAYVPLTQSFAEEPIKRVNLDQIPTLLSREEDLTLERGTPYLFWEGGLTKPEAGMLHMCLRECRATYDVPLGSGADGTGAPLYFCRSYDLYDTQGERIKPELALWDEHKTAELLRGHGTRNGLPSKWATVITRV